MPTAVIGAVASVGASMIGANAAKSAGNTQARATAEAAAMSREAAEKARGEILDRMVPAFSTYRAQMDANRTELLNGQTDVFRLLQDSTGMANNILSNAGADAQRAILGAESMSKGVPRGEFNTQYAQGRYPGQTQPMGAGALPQAPPVGGLAGGYQGGPIGATAAAELGVNPADAITPEMEAYNQKTFKLDIGGDMGVSGGREMPMAEAYELGLTGAEPPPEGYIPADEQAALQAQQARVVEAGRQIPEWGGRTMGGGPGDGGLGGVRGAGDAQGIAAMQKPEYGFAPAMGRLEQGERRGLGFLQQGASTARNDIFTGRDAALGQLASAEQRALDRYQPYSEAGQGAIGQEAALSGAMGPEAQAEAQAAFMESPGQKYLRERQEQALLRSSAAIGGLGGGNVRTALQEQAMGIAATQQQQALENLRSIASRGQQVAGAEAGLIGGMGQQAAGITGQAAQQAAGIAQQLGMSQSQLASLSAQQQSQLANNTGLNIAQIQQAVGAAQAGNVAGMGGQLASARAGTAGDLAGTYGSQAAQEMTSQQNIASTLANLATQSGTQQAGLTAQGGSALAAGQYAAGQTLGQGLANLGQIGMYAANQYQPQVQPQVGTTQWSMQNPGLANLPTT